MYDFHILNWTLPDGTELQAPTWLDEHECKWLLDAIQDKIDQGEITDQRSLSSKLSFLWHCAQTNAVEADVENGFGEFNRPIVYDKDHDLERALRERTNSIWYRPGEFVKIWSSPVDRFRDTYQGVAQLLQFKCAVGYAFGYPIELWRVRFVDGNLEGQEHDCQVWASGRSIVVQDPSMSVHDRVTKDRLPHPPGTLVFGPISSPPTNHPEETSMTEEPLDTLPGTTTQPGTTQVEEITVGELIERLQKYDPDMPVEIVVKSVLGAPVTRKIILAGSNADFIVPAGPDPDFNEDDVFYLIGGMPREILTNKTGKEIDRWIGYTTDVVGHRLYDG